MLFDLFNGATHKPGTRRSLGREARQHLHRVKFSSGATELSDRFVEALADAPTRRHRLIWFISDGIDRSHDSYLAVKHLVLIRQVSQEAINHARFILIHGKNLLYLNTR